MRLLASLALGLLLITAGCFSEPRVYQDELRSVPDVVGERVQDAREALESQGFLVRIIPDGATPPPPVIEPEPEGTCASGTVVEQDPPRNEEVMKASTVVLAASGC